MRFSVLSSGSKANCTYIEASGVRLLIDCGLSGKQTESRLAEIGVRPDSIDAILVTHEHSDHIYGIHTFSRRHKVPVYINRATYEQLDREVVHEFFVTGEEFCVESVTISPFSIVHDAADPVGFAVKAEGFKFVQVTDLGRVTTLVHEQVQGANALVLESNHDQEMLQNCDYTWHLKQRIASTHGHLSNDAAGQLLSDTLHPELFHVVLGHLSENSNTPTLALQTANRYLELCKDRARTLKTLLCGSISQSTPLLELDGESATAVA